MEFYEQTRKRGAQFQCVFVALSQCNLIAPQLIVRIIITVSNVKVCVPTCIDIFFRE